MICFPFFLTLTYLANSQFQRIIPTAKCFLWEGMSLKACLTAENVLPQQDTNVR